MLTKSVKSVISVVLGTLREQKNPCNRCDP